MRTLKTTLILAILFTMGVANAQNWNLVWQDEFDYAGAPDPAKWNYTIWNPGMVNNEYQAYTDRSENVRVENGALIIEGRRDWGNGHEYTSGRINSSWKGAFTYGRMEARMILPGGSGTWPAFWMMPDDPYKYATTCDASTGWDADCDAWPNSGEIDIMEYVGNDYGNVHGSIHSKNYYFKLGNQRTGHTYVEDPETNYHVYAIEWFEDHIDYFVDDIKYYTTWNDGTGWESWPFNHNFHIILNLAIGGDWGAAGGFNPAVFEAGAKMYVDYVRVYEAGATPYICNATPVPAVIQAEEYCNYQGTQTEYTSDNGGGMNVGYIDANDWLDYTINVPAAGNYNIDFRVASLNGGGVFEIISDEQVLATVNVPATGDWQAWSTLSTQVTLPAGDQIIKLNTLTGGYNLNWFDFSSMVPVLTSIEVTPSTTSINKGETLQYSANAFDQFGNPYSTSFNWSASGGSIDQNGLFSGTVDGNFTVTASSENITGTASITVNPIISGVEIPVTIEAENWVNMFGVQTESCIEGGLNVGWIDAGDWLEYYVSLSQDQYLSVNYRVASLNGGGEIQLRDASGAILNSTTVPQTGDWQTWTTISSEPVFLTAGTFTIRIHASLGGYNLNWIEFVSIPDPNSDTEAPTTPTNLSVSTTATTADLNWNASSDNVGVTGYNVFLDGTYYTSTTNTYMQITGLSNKTGYSFAVSAYDMAGNESGQIINNKRTRAKSATVDINQNESVLKVYPNPASEFVKITTNLHSFSYEIYSIQGQLIKSDFSDKNILEIELNNYKKGIYIIKINNTVQRFIKN